jgi:hypothetical protein
MTLTLTKIEGIQTLKGIPEQGKRFLSVNLALVDVAELMDIAKELGFKPQLVQMPCVTHIEIHALLWHELIHGILGFVLGRYLTSKFMHCFGTS